ncbi:tRNA (adenosine(37)-N6)-threonylcarbamoyltransferase complex dimerization subunit type 1 TsaB [Constantimarinum furrinae]|uniref:tRNA threonylcarbamoyladenosine biosynthesis protein TsaB n=1 Tax=Constantimarinum furrinae TaxID=2562285 RepID=A0A7G8PU25_9FLAO|nr:tRNA (adenosine(37)-N6)-threonylcarbamoyltransferase complex dimerization subunit type 1 TsaB [Constantimarinum furrinae]QNJ97841.1 tRNA threonylcarbamoyladenosine biosynthesis protein TsaB [Constantimarinum furrinae]
MATILCLETATTNCSVALSVNGSVISLREDDSPGFSHAEKLHVFIEEVLREGRLKNKDIDAIAVSRGPGSYTGLRIGVSAAKGMCFALDIPLLSIATLQSLAAGVMSSEGLVIPMLDARRMEVYSAVYSPKNIQIRETRAEIVTPQSFASFLEKGRVTFVGSGVKKFKEICNHPNAVFIEGISPSARNMAALAEDKHKKSDLEDVAYFEPYYLKDFLSH